jgi:hypothetical protein
LFQFVRRHRPKLAFPDALVESRKKLDAGGGLGCLGDKMKMKIFLAFLGVAIITTGCINTVSGTRTGAVPFQTDRVEGRYQRSVDLVYQAAVQVIQNDGVLMTEFIPHDTTNTVRALQGKVNQRNVWVRVAAENPQITQVTVQARTKGGNSDIELAHQLEKELALKLATQ